MESFLQHCRNSSDKLSQFKHVEIVIGNEACDLDSAVSSIVYAYLRHHELSSNSSNDSQSCLALPVMNVLKADLKLRREIVFWFENVIQFPLDCLVCRDEIDYDSLKNCNVTISLVDHNENREIVRNVPHARVENIVDHHKPTYGDGQCQAVDASKVLIDTAVGSCCSLVALKYLNCGLESLFGLPGQTIAADSQIALLLYGPILLDTICFNPSAKRFSAKDHEAINKLEERLKHSDEAETSMFDRNDVFQRLSDARDSLEGMSFEELLRKDMKIVEACNMTICISAITGTQLTDMSLKEKTEDFKRFCENPPTSAILSGESPRLFNGLVLLSMDARIPNNLRRQLAIFCTNKHLMRAIATCLEKSEIELELITAFDTLRIYNQNNLHATRKTILPIIKTILNGPEQHKPSDEGAKNSEGQALVSPTTPIAGSAPSSFIQAPDGSVYGSFIADSYVGDFVGEYDMGEPNADHSTENLFTLDPEGQLVMNPNPESAYNSHPHEIEFDFDSFGPESLIYANGGSEPHKSELEHVVEDVPTSETQIDEKSFEDDGLRVTPISDAPPEIHIQDLSRNNDDEDDGDGELKGSAEHTHNDSGNSSIADTTTSSAGGGHLNNGNEDIVEEQQQQHQQQQEKKIDHDKSEDAKEIQETVNQITEIVTKLCEEEQEQKQKNELRTFDDEPQSSSSTTPEHQGVLKQQLDLDSQVGSFSRNNTLTKSQRKKVLPQVTIKNLLMTSETYSPPVLDSVVQIPLNESPLKPISPLVNREIEANSEENFIRSSKSIAADDHSGGGESLSERPTSLDIGDFSPGGLQRQPSMKRKVPVNYNILLENNFDKDDEANETEKIVEPLESSAQCSNEVQNGASTSTVTTSETVSATVGKEELNKSETPSPAKSSVLDEFNLKEIDMNVIEPYKKVLSHGGYMHASVDGQHVEGASPAIIVFSACYLPDRSRKDYNYVMENLFAYVLQTLHNMIGDDYLLIYLHNGGTVQAQDGSPIVGNNMPTFSWLKRCYQMMDRKLKKNLKGLYLVHPTFWLKTLIIMSKPFISTKFSKKLKFVNSLEELAEIVPIQHIAFPTPVVA